MRFLVYTVVAMSYLEYFLFIRCAVLWNDRNRPSVSTYTRPTLDPSLAATDVSQYFGPSTAHLLHLFVLAATNSLTLALLFIFLVRTMWSLGGNVTTIESWEIERHSRLLRRSRVLGGYLDGPNGVKIRIQKQEFPYDIGILSNIAQGMGSKNPLTWIWPFAATPSTSGLDFETNGFEDPSTSWPPPDPDRMPRFQAQRDPSEAFTYQNRQLSDYDEIEAFKRRQEEDIRRQQNQMEIRHRKPFHERINNHADLPGVGGDEGGDTESGSESGEEGWQDSGGNRLKDFGVEEEVEFYDEDDIPLSELLRRRNAQNK